MAVVSDVLRVSSIQIKKDLEKIEPEGETFDKSCGAVVMASNDEYDNWN